MLLEIPVNADTAQNAARQAVMLAKAQGYNSVQVRNTMMTDIPDVADAFTFLSQMRSFTVKLEVSRGF